MELSRRSQRARLSIEVGPELQQKLETAAAQHGRSVHDYVVSLLRRAVGEQEHNDPQAIGIAWSRASVRSFARDWKSEEDKAYDQLRF